jgi:putative peptide zinc metalloprotease protein
LQVRNDSKIAFSNVSWRRDNGTYIVWKQGTTDFIELTESSFTAYRLLQEGKTPQEVAETLKNKYEETYDVTDFVREMTKLGFVSSIDGIPLSSSPPKKTALGFLKKDHVSWIYSKPLLLFYMLLILSAATVLVFNPAYLPSYSDFFFVDNYLVVLLVSFALGLAVVFFHEVGHLIAGKAAGVDGYFSIGMRLYIPVAETNLTQLWLVPRNKRNLPFLAGMLNDLLLLSVLVLLLWLSDQSILLDLGAFAAYARLVILLLYYGLIWQFLLFIRTDLYYVISNLFGCRNLYSDSWTYVLNLLLGLFKGKRIEYLIPPNELRVVRVYAPFMLVATVLATLLFAFLGLPIFVLVFVEGAKMLFDGLQGNVMLFAEGLALTFLMGLQVFGFLFFLVKTLFRFRSSLKSVAKEVS